MENVILAACASLLAVTIIAWTLFGIAVRNRIAAQRQESERIEFFARERKRAILFQAATLERNHN